MQNLYNINVSHVAPVLSPLVLKQHIAMPESHQNLVYQSRETIKNILNGHDKRLMVIVGPCSIHDPKSALEYAHKLKTLSDQLNDKLFIIMRVYFEKPRTTTGWKGLINDPHLNEGFDIETGLEVARQLMYDITEIGLPIGTEALDPISPQYIADYVSWSAVGARTTESQTHREMASGLSSPVGFKNGTDGSIEVAINAILSAQQPHSFLGINEQGSVSIIKTTGNAFGHVILRGGSKGPNYNSVCIAEALEKMKNANVNSSLVVDCSHGNSHKDFRKQTMVLKDVVFQKQRGTNEIKGVMLESHLVEGAQKLTLETRSSLVYGQSITDGCIGWEATEELLNFVAEAL